MYFMCLEVKFMLSKSATNLKLVWKLLSYVTLLLNLHSIAMIMMLFSCGSKGMR